MAFDLLQSTSKNLQNGPLKMTVFPKIPLQQRFKKLFSVLKCQYFGSFFLAFSSCAISTWLLTCYRTSKNLQNGSKITAFSEYPISNYTVSSYSQAKNTAENVAKTRYPFRSRCPWPSLCIQITLFSRIRARFWVAGTVVCDLVGLRLRTSLVGRPSPIVHCVWTNWLMLCS